MNTTKTLYLNTDTDSDILEWLESQEGSVSNSIRRAIRYLLNAEQRQLRMLERILREIKEIKEQGIQIAAQEVERPMAIEIDLPDDIAQGLKGLIK